MAKKQDGGPVYPTETLLKSKLLSAYQPDFAKAVLTEAAYTKSAALCVLDRILKGGH